MENNKENKYKEGDVVYQKTNPAVALVVRRFFKRVYYCNPQKGALEKELVLFEREIATNNNSRNPEY